ncbi:hypothetical protein [uncultured Xanthomonas sp.]|uniref:hypothetical protein n=1 Tax=uncultured Xanthomonas sp. TaxID=152831 RepID=UPI0025CC0087|nr:hypothetical protein [uncultured Xanthomonas sp.]
MTALNYAPIPNTLAFLNKLKRPKPPSAFDRIQRFVFKATLAFGGVILVAAVLGFLGLLSKEVTRFLTMLPLIGVLTLFLIWAISQIVEMLLAVRTGYHNAANSLDRDIEHDDVVVQELTACDPFKLRERSKHMEAKSKRLTRQAGMGSVIAAIGAVVINFQTSAEKAEMLVHAKDLPLFVYSGSLGVLLGAAALTVFASKLEHIASLLSLAADRIDRK